MAKTWHQLEIERLTCVALLVVATLDCQAGSRPYLTVGEPASLRFRAPLQSASPALLAALTLPSPALTASAVIDNANTQSSVQELASAPADPSPGQIGPNSAETQPLDLDGQNWDSALFGTNTAVQVSQPTITAQMLLDLLRNGSSAGPKATNSLGAPAFMPPLPPVRSGSRATYRLIDP